MHVHVDIDVIVHIDDLHSQDISNPTFPSIPLKATKILQLSWEPEWFINLREVKWGKHKFLHAHFYINTATKSWMQKQAILVWFKHNQQNTLGKASCFPRSTDWNINLIQKRPNRYAQNHVWPSTWAHCDIVKMIHKIKYYKS